MKKSSLLATLITMGISSLANGNINQLKTVIFEDQLVVIEDPRTLNEEEIKYLKELYHDAPEFLEYLKVPEELEQTLIDEINENGTSDQIFTLEDMLQHDERNDIDFWILKPWVEETTSDEIEVDDNEKNERI